MSEQLYRFISDCGCGDGVGCNDAVLAPVTIDYEAVKAVTTKAVRLGNNMAAYNSGMGDDEIEAEGKEYADDIMELLGGDE